jgi:hypothetical protein
VKIRVLSFALACAATFTLIGCHNSTTTGLSADEAISIATDAYIYGYPLVTMDMTRKQLTNVAVPDAAHAPVGQLLGSRTYPAVDNHVVSAPNADTLYTTAWLDVSKEPWVFSIPDMGVREPKGGVAWWADGSY